MSQKDIQTVMELTGLSRTKSQQLLVAAGSIEDAVNQHFDGADNNSGDDDDVPPPAPAAKEPQRGKPAAKKPAAKGKKAAAAIAVDSSSSSSDDDVPPPAPAAKMPQRGKLAAKKPAAKGKKVAVRRGRAKDDSDDTAEEGDKSDDASDDDDDSGSEVSSDDAPPAPAAKKGKAAAKKPAAKGKKAAAAAKAVASDGDDGSSSSDDDESSDNDNSDSDSDSDSSSSDEDDDDDDDSDNAPRARRAAPKKRAPGKKAAAKKKQKDSDDDSDDSDDDDDSDDADVAIATVGRNSSTAQLVLNKADTRVVDEFEQEIATVFPDATAGRTALKKLVEKECKNNVKTVIKRLTAACDAVLSQWTGTDARPKPMQRVTVTIPKPLAVAALCNENCPCLATAAETSYADTKKKIIRHGFLNGSLTLCVPSNVDNNHRFIKNNDGITWRFAYGAGANNLVPTLSACPPALKHSMVAFVGGRRMVLFSPDPITNRNWEQLLPAFMRSGSRHMYQVGESELPIVVMPPLSRELSTKEHVEHQLYLRLRAVVPRPENEPSADFIEAAALPFFTLAKTQQQLWAHRFAILSVLQMHAPELLETDARRLTFDRNLLLSLPTPAALFEKAKELQTMSSKQLLEALDKFLVRESIDVSGVPERPTGMAPGLKLFPHQRRSVAFMLQAERGCIQQMLVVPPLNKAPLQTTTEGKHKKQYRFHINMAMGAIVAAEVGSAEERELLNIGGGVNMNNDNNNGHNPQRRSGVIEASSVGLGKTISVLSVIAMNPSRNPSPYVAESGVDVGMSSPPPARKATAAEERLRVGAGKKLFVKATLILAPVSLVSSTWESEIRKAYPGMKVLRLHGATRSKATYAQIAAADIVITTYETYRIAMKEEMHFNKWLPVHTEFSSLARQRFVAATDATSNRILDVLTLEGTPQSVGQWKSEARSCRKLGQLGPEIDRPQLSRIHFHRLVLDEVQKPSAVSGDFPWFVSSTHTILVSGTVLDCDFSSAMKRLGLMDFSFVPQDRVRYITSLKESQPPVFVDEWLQSTLFSEKAWQISVAVPPTFAWTPPAGSVASFAKIAALSAFAIRQTLETCPELAHIVLTERVVSVRLSEAESKAFNESLDSVRKKFRELEKRGRVTTRMLSVIQLLNQLRQAVVDPFGTTIKQEDALTGTVGAQGAQFHNENEKRSIVPVPCVVFAWLVAGPEAGFEDPQTILERTTSSAANLANNNNNKRKSAAAAAAAAAAPEIDTASMDPDNGDYDFIRKMKRNFKDGLCPSGLIEELKGYLSKPPVLATCCICLDSILQPVVLQCSHSLCRECALRVRKHNDELDQAEQAKTVCPSCRGKTMADNVKKVLLTFPLLQLRHDRIEELEEEAAENCGSQSALVKRRPPSDDDDDDDDDALKNKGNNGGFPTKIQTVIDIIVDSLEEDNTSKFVIFTSFPSVLIAVRKALTAASIGSVVIDGSTSLSARGKAVTQFQNREEFNIRCCILSSRVAAAGLTLTAANHLIIVEPVQNADIRVQIIGRIKRLSQTRPVTVHDIIVENTLERGIFDAVAKRTLTLSGGGNERDKQAAVDQIKKLLWPNGMPQDEPGAGGGGRGQGDDGSDDDFGGGGGGGGAAAGLLDRLAQARAQRLARADAKKKTREGKNKKKNKKNKKKKKKAGRPWPR